MDSAASAPPYAQDMPIQPRPNADTSRPCRPSFLFSIDASLAAKQLERVARSVGRCPSREAAAEDNPARKPLGVHVYHSPEGATDLKLCRRFRGVGQQRRREP